METAQCYIRRPDEYVAILVDLQNALEVLQLLGYDKVEIRQNRQNEDSRYIFSANRGEELKTFEANPGQVVVRNPDGSVLTMTEAEFRRSFQPSPDWMNNS